MEFLVDIFKTPYTIIVIVVAIFIYRYDWLVAVLMWILYKLPFFLLIAVCLIILVMLALYFFQNKIIYVNSGFFFTEIK